MRILLITTLFCLSVLSVLSSTLFAAQLSTLSGAVAYTETVRFDYARNGVRNHVQFWLKFEGTPALGTPGDSGYQPESGAIYYYLVDMDNKKEVVGNWLMGFSMMEGPPPSGPYPMTRIHITEDKATFNAFGMTWTVIDGGEGYARDTVKVDDGFQVRSMQMYGGDLHIATTDVDAQIESRACTSCHQEAVSEMQIRGGQHSSLGCGVCHVGHPPDMAQAYGMCLDCHEPHSEQMNQDACGACHRAHTVTVVTYMFNVPPRYCRACHQEAADALAANGSKHSIIPCALCHQERHPATLSCRYCHGAPHSEEVMMTGTCAACHDTAHDLETGR